MKKIAFLFLIIDNPHFTKIWDSYLRGKKDKYSLYIHPKYPDKLIWKKKNVIKDLQETAWGYITRAYIALLREAYKDKDNYKFITISESDIPIKTFDQFYNDATNDNKSIIKLMKIKPYNYGARIEPQKTKPKPKNFIKHYARFMLNREHVEQLLKMDTEGIMNFFHNMQVGDEFFLSVLYPLHNIRDFDVTFDDWDYTKKIRDEYNLKIKLLYEEQEKKGKNNNKEILELKKLRDDISKNPKTIINVEEDLDKIKKCHSYFYRKFSKESNIEKYWKEIIHYHT